MVWQGRKVDCYKRLAHPLRSVVDGAGKELFASTVISFDQNGQISSGNFLRYDLGLLNVFTFSDNVIKTIFGVVSGSNQFSAHGLHHFAGLIGDVGYSLGKI